MSTIVAALGGFCPQGNCFSCVLHFMNIVFFRDDFSSILTQKSPQLFPRKAFLSMLFSCPTKHLVTLFWKIRENIENLHHFQSFFTFAILPGHQCRGLKMWSWPFEHHLIDGKHDDQRSNFGIPQFSDCLRSSVNTRFNSGKRSLR